MRTTIAIDDDVLAAARTLADRHRKSIGAVISELAREGLTREIQPPEARRNGIPLLSNRAGVVVTAELVNRLRDESP